MPQMKKPELLSPAGDWPSLKAVIAAGADSVYFGVRGLNMRAGAANFEESELDKVMGVLHERDRKGYLTVNSVIMDGELAAMARVLRKARKAGVDAVILWDLAALTAARDLGLRVHLSTQASVANRSAFAAYAALGADRVVLARECALTDIAGLSRLRARGRLSCEIECFVHGAMCVSVSGRCFLSALSHGTSANRGECYQPCRREYVLTAMDGGPEYVAGRDYLLSPKDLCALPFLEKLIAAGADSLKIEGRARPPEYGRVVTAVYREAIDAHCAGGLTDERKARLQSDLARVYNRGFSSGFYFGRPDREWSRGLEQTHRKIFLGEVMKYYPGIGVADIRLMNHGLCRGEELLFVGKQTPALFALAEEIQKDRRGVEQAEKGERVGVKLPFAVRPKDKVFLWEDGRESGPDGAGVSAGGTDHRKEKGGG